MNSKNLTKRIITSIPLLILLGLSFNYSFILIFSLFLISLISFIEFNYLISKILKTFVYKATGNILFLIYLTLFSLIIFSSITQDNLKINMLYIFSICICSDIGGLIFGKVFKGRKLTKVSPNKTIAGSIGSFILSLVLVPVFYYLYQNELTNILHITLLAILVSFFCQLGDLFISFLKRKANVKDTGNILPGHGGLLDRIDGILLAVPIGAIIWQFLIIFV